MNKKELQSRYKQAGLLYIMKEYEDALDILDELLEEVPHCRELLVAKVKCLVALGFREEAKTICRHLITVYKDAHAAALFSRLNQGTSWSQTS